MIATKRCPDCGTESPADAVFCESCGRRLSAEGRDGPPGSQPSAGVPQADGRRRLRAIALVVIAVLAVGGAFAAGFVIADDGDEVADLERQSSELRGQRDDLRAERDGLRELADDAEAEADDAQDKVASLEERLEAELGLKGEGNAPSDATSTPADADLRMGQAGTVGSLILKPTSFVRTGGNGEATTYTATITVKNNGSEPVGPFCGGSGAEVEDSQGRSFDGESVLSDNTRNCGDDLQPGLTGANYKMKFSLPANAKPALLRLYDEFDESTGKSWAVK